MSDNSLANLCFFFIDPSWKTTRHNLLTYMRQTIVKHVPSKTVFLEEKPLAHRSQWPSVARTLFQGHGSEAPLNNYYSWRKLLLLHKKIYQQWSLLISTTKIHFLTLCFFHRTYIDSEVCTLLFDFLLDFSVSAPSSSSVTYPSDCSVLEGSFLHCNTVKSTNKMSNSLEFCIVFNYIFLYIFLRCGSLWNIQELISSKANLSMEF